MLNVDYRTYKTMQAHAVASTDFLEMWINNGRLCVVLRYNYIYWRATSYNIKSDSMLVRTCSSLRSMTMHTTARTTTNSQICCNPLLLYHREKTIIYKNVKKKKQNMYRYKNCPKQSFVCDQFRSYQILFSETKTHIVNTYSSVFWPWLIYYHAYFRSIITIG